jgi:nuclear cap-binding protein subunit 1
MVADNHDDENLRNMFLDLVVQLLLEQPLKTPFVAAVVLIINTLKSEFVDDVLARLAEVTQDKIAQGAWRDVKLLLKFLACLQSLLEGDGVFPLLEELFSRAADLQTASSDDVSRVEASTGSRLLTRHD